MFDGGISEPRKALVRAHSQPQSNYEMTHEVIFEMKRTGIPQHSETRREVVSAGRRNVQATLAREC